MRNLIIMPLRIVHICQADADAAKYDMFNHPHPLVQKRALCLYMKFQDFEHEAIARVLGCNRGTVANYLDLYESGGYEGLSCIAYNTPSSDLDAHRFSLEASFRQQPPRSIKEAAHRIKELTGVERSPSRVRAFLHRIGMKRLRTGQIPAKADAQEQQKFHDETLQPLLLEAKAGKCHVLFLDSAHFVLAAFVAMVWCFERVFVKTAPGRFRINVIGPSMLPPKNSLPCITQPISMPIPWCNSSKKLHASMPAYPSTSFWTTPDTNIANLSKMPL